MLLNDFLTTNVPFSLDLLPQNSYLVGGCVRDVLLGRKRHYLDLDFVTPHSAILTAGKIARLHQAGFVILDQQRNIARVVFNSMTIDIAQQEGTSIEQDLSRRDYTINAIAFDYHNQKIIDPLQGEKDLQQGIIRMLSKNNLQEDPLRLLRGYRQACQLDFTIEASTRRTIKQLVPLLKNVAQERINSELGYLLNNIRGSKWLQTAFDDHLLSICFPDITQNQVSLLPQIDSAIELLETKNHISIESQWRGLAKLACLVNRNSQTAEQQLTTLKYSRQEIKTVTILLQYTPILRTQDFVTNLRKQYFFFASVGKIFPVLAIFALANNLSERLILGLFDRYYNPQDSVIHPQPLLTGKDLIQHLQLSPSPLIGELLTEVQIAHIENQISTKAEAIKWIQKYLETKT